MIRILVSLLGILLCLGASVPSTTAQSDDWFFASREPIVLANAGQVELLATLTVVGRIDDFLWTEEGFIVNPTTGEIYPVPQDSRFKYTLALASASAISRDRSRFALGSATGTVIIFDTVTLDEIAVLNVNKHRITAITTRSS